MNKERLLKLAALLDKHRDNGVRFDLADWRVEGKEKDWCGTKACAVGLACTHPEFVSDGLGLQSSNGFAPTYQNGDYSGWDAVQEFFDLDWDSSWWLFAASEYKGKTYGNAAARKVAKRIRQFVKNG